MNVNNNNNNNNNNNTRKNSQEDESRQWSVVPSRHQQSYTSTSSANNINSTTIRSHHQTQLLQKKKSNNNNINHKKQVQNKVSSNNKLIIINPKNKNKNNINNDNYNNNTKIKKLQQQQSKEPELKIEEFPPLLSLSSSTTTVVDNSITIATKRGWNNNTNTYTNNTNTNNNIHNDTSVIDLGSKQPTKNDISLLTSNNSNSSNNSTNNNSNKRRLTNQHNEELSQRPITTTSSSSKKVAKKSLSSIITSSNNNNNNNTKHKTKDSSSLLLDTKKKKVIDLNIKKSSTLSSSSSKSTTNHNFDDDAFIFHKSNMLQIPLSSSNNNNNHNMFKKGKQKLRTRKKRLSPLKKQVLKERLLQWKQKQLLENSSSKTNMSDGNNNGDSANSIVQSINTPIIYLYGYIEEGEQIVDDDEYEEIVDDLKEMAGKIGPIHSLHIPRQGQNDHIETAVATNFGISFVRFMTLHDAETAKNCWDGMIIGGNLIKVDFVSKRILMKNYHSVGGDEDDSESYLDNYIDLVKNISLAELEADNALDVMEKSIKSGVVLLGNILTDDDFEDEGCMEESLGDIKTLASKYGDVIHDNFHVDRVNRTVHIMYAEGYEVALKAATQLNGTVIGGQIISAIPLNNDNISSHVERSLDISSIVYLQGFLEQGEPIDDDDEYEEIESDLRDISSRYVQGFSSTFIPRDGKHGLCFVCFQSEQDAVTAKDEWDGMIIGGNKIKAGIISKKQMRNASKDEDYLSHWSDIVQGLLQTKDISEIECWTLSLTSSRIVVLGNILTEDDFEDEGCMEESLEDIKMLALQFGQLTGGKLHVDLQSQTVHIQYIDNTAALSAASRLDGLVIGGQTISANVLSSDEVNGLCSIKTDQSVGKSKLTVNDKGETKTDPIYSGDKIIPEQYAECKRVPKIPNSGQPRSYASLIGNDEVIPLLYEMLGELMRLQLRSKDAKNANARRRLVLGLREVARGVRANKVTMIICANNLDEYGVIDEKIQSIIDLAEEKEIPIIYELNKRKIGKAMGKTIKVSIVGIQNADGAQVQYKKLKRIFHHAR